MNALLGFGLDAQYANRYPNGILALCDSFRDRLSHLSIVSLFDYKSAATFKTVIARDLSIVHHLPGVAPADPDGPHLDLLSDMNTISNILDAKWICEDIAIWRIGPYNIPYFTPPIFDSCNADILIAKIDLLQKNANRVFLAEIPSCALVVGNMPLGEFFSKILAEADCKLLCDVSHVYSYAIAKKQDPVEVLKSLPLNQVWELHISGGHIDQNSDQRYIDTHSELIIDEIIELLGIAAKSCANLKCITYEVGVGLTLEQICFDFDRIESKLNHIGWLPSIKSFSTF